VAKISSAHILLIAFSIGRISKFNLSVKFEIISIAVCTFIAILFLLVVKIKTYDKLDIIPKFFKSEINKNGINAKCGSDARLYNIFFSSNNVI
jgi:hypothetical protein